MNELSRRHERVRSSGVIVDGEIKKINEKADRVPFAVFVIR